MTEVEKLEKRFNLWIELLSVEIFKLKGKIMTLEHIVEKSTEEPEDSPE